LVLSAVALALVGFATPAETTSPFGGNTPEPFKPGAHAELYGLAELDSINLHGGGLAFQVPLYKVGGRGQAGYSIMANIRRNWQIETSFDNLVYSYSPKTSDTPFGDWWVPKVPLYSPGVVVGRRGASGGQLCNASSGDPNAIESAVSKIVFIAADRSEVELIDADTDGQIKPVICQPVGTPLLTHDRKKIFRDKQGQNITFISSTNIVDDGSWTSGEPLHFAVSGYLFFPSGVRYEVNAGKIVSIRDRNGNLVSLTYDANGDLTTITDPLKRTVSIAYASSSVTDPVYNYLRTYTHTISYTRTVGSSTTTRSIVLTYKSLHAVSGSESPVTFEALWGTYGGLTLFNPAVLQSIAYPNGKSFTFAYNKYGELTRATLPTGGYFLYTHEGGTPGSTVGSYQRVQPYRRVTAKEAFDHGGAKLSRIEYSALDQPISNPPDATGLYSNTLTTVVHRDAANQIVRQEKHYFYGGPANINNYGYRDIEYPRWRDGKRYKLEILDPLGAVISSSDETWAQRPCEIGEFCLYWDAVLYPGLYGASSEKWTINDPRQTYVQSNLHSPLGTRSSATSFSYDRYNNVTSQYEYAFADGTTPTVLLRRSDTAYFATDAPDSFDEDNPSGYVHLRGIKTSAEVFDASSVSAARTEYFYDESAPEPRSDAAQYSAPPSPRKNLTRVREFTGASTYTDLRAEYDVLGNVIKTYDGRGNHTTFDFTDNFAGTTNLGSQKAYAFPRTATNALNHVTAYQYDYFTGKATQVQGPVTGTSDRDTTTASYADTMDRLVSVTASVGSTVQRTTDYIYGDNPGDIHIRTLSPLTFANPSVKVETRTKFDGFGRKTVDILHEASTQIETHTTYDSRGLVKTQSLPYRTGEGALQWTTTTYDALDRPTKVKTADNAETNITYDRNIVTRIDPAGKSIRHIADSLGRLVEVVENPGGLTYQTHYTYSPRNDLQYVCQGGTLPASTCTGGMKRTFAYDKKGRLLSANNPESGVIAYTYDSADNLVTRQDARSLVTCNGTWSSSTSTCDTTGPNAGYDELNRPRKRTYNDVNTPPVTWVWDTARTGYLTSVSNSASTTAFTYFVNGWVQTSAQTPAGASAFNFTYAYHPSGALATMIYPSSRQVTYAPDAAGRIASIGSGSTAYWSSVQYAPQGAPTQVTLGNGLIERWGFSTARQQPIEVKLGTSTNAVEKGQWQFRYCGGFGDVSCSANNGNVLGQMHTIGGANFNQTYHYDPLNRICSVRETASTTPLGPRNCDDVSGVIGGETWFQAYSVDRFGNLATPTDPNINVHPLTVRSLSDYDTATNRLKTLSGIWNYDAAGNLTKHGGWTLAYDAENRQKTSQPSGGSVTTYDYDGDGRRVKKTTGATSTWFVYDASGQLAAEYTAAGPSGSSATHYLTTDHLGSTRLVTDASKNVISRHDYLPYGWEIYTGITSRTTAQGYSASPSTLATPTQRFTGKERDTLETGLDYFGARYFSPGQGRFTSADAPFADQQTEDPQSWNLYGYVRNRPLALVDETGEQAQVATEKALRVLEQVAKRYAGNPSQAVKDLAKIAEVYRTVSTLTESLGPHATNAGTISGLLETTGLSPQAQHDRTVGFIGSTLLPDLVENGINQVYYNSDGTRKTDVDLETSYALIEVKTGGKANMNQFVVHRDDREVNPGGKPVVIYGPQFSTAQRKAFEAAGARVAGTFEELRDILYQLKQDQGR
jgi:RHS repeat-associated protein